MMEVSIEGTRFWIQQTSEVSVSRVSKTSKSYIIRIYACKIATLSGRSSRPRIMEIER
jgi:hypothetical protein